SIKEHPARRPPYSPVSQRLCRRIKPRGRRRGGDPTQTNPIKARLVPEMGEQLTPSTPRTTPALATGADCHENAAASDSRLPLTPTTRCPTMRQSSGEAMEKL